MPRCTDAVALVDAAKVALIYFNQGITSSALIVASESVYTPDTHAEQDAAKSPALLAKLMTDVASVFELLVKTPYPGQLGLSMLDVTTVMVSSEFGRSHGQSQKPVDKTGTDHNP